MLYFFIGCIIIFVLVEIYIFLYGQKRENVVVDYILVLGCGLDDEKPSQALKRRLDAAYEFSCLHPTIPLIVSGGKGNDEKCSEANAMKMYLLQKGVDEAKIIMEDQSVCTYTNFEYTKRLLKKTCTLMVVSCDFHMYRAIALGRNAGFTCYRWPAKSTTLYSVKNFVREFGCILYFWVKKR